ARFAAVAPAQSALSLLPMPVSPPLLGDTPSVPTLALCLTVFPERSRVTPRPAREYLPARGYGQAPPVRASFASRLVAGLRRSVFRSARWLAETSAIAPIPPPRRLQTHPARSTRQFSGRMLFSATFRMESLLRP